MYFTIFLSPYILGFNKEKLSNSGKKDIGYETLSEMLKEIGVEENKMNIANKRHPSQPIDN